MTTKAKEPEIENFYFFYFTNVQKLKISKIMVFK